MEGRTLGTTLGIHYQLRAFSLFALFLELIWTVSPRGGQSIMRVLETRVGTLTRLGNVVCLDSHSQSHLASWSDVSPTSSAYEANRMSIFNAMYSTLISLGLDVVKSSAMDVWENVKNARVVVLWGSRYIRLAACSSKRYGAGVLVSQWHEPGSNRGNNPVLGAGWNLALDSFVGELWSDNDLHIQRDLSVEDANATSICFLREGSPVSY
ncbi:hypothetical protein LZ31DRAFT_596338 [Colletotrichum somersetense]|nr:hypothetical protein LZ31DRAFT_596338 [Colletotrichum somersetense]